MGTSRVDGVKGRRDRTESRSNIFYVQFTDWRVEHVRQRVLEPSHDRFYICSCFNKAHPHVQVC